MPRAPPRSSGAAGAPCRSRGSSRPARCASSAARARLSASWVAAGGAGDRGLPPQRLGRRPELVRDDAGAHGIERQLVERQPARRPHQIGPARAERIVDVGSKAIEQNGLEIADGQPLRLRWPGRARHRRRERHRRRGGRASPRRRRRRGTSSTATGEGDALSGDVASPQTSTRARRASSAAARHPRQLRRDPRRVAAHRRRHRRGVAARHRDQRERRLLREPRRRCPG